MRSQIYGKELTQTSEIPVHVNRLPVMKMIPDGSLRIFITWQENPAYQRVIFESDISEVVTKLMCSKEVHLFHNHMLVKKKNTSKNFMTAGPTVL